MIHQPPCENLLPAMLEYSDEQALHFDTDPDLVTCINHLIDSLEEFKEGMVVVRV